MSVSNRLVIYLTASVLIACWAVPVFAGEPSSARDRTIVRVERKLKNTRRPAPSQLVWFDRHPRWIGPSYLILGIGF